jgi:hypothetical protein
MASIVGDDDTIILEVLLAVLRDQGALLIETMSAFVMHPICKQRSTVELSCDVPEAARGGSSQRQELESNM